MFEWRLKIKRRGRERGDVVPEFACIIPTDLYNTNSIGTKPKKGVRVCIYSSI